MRSLNGGILAVALRLRVTAAHGHILQGRKEPWRQDAWLCRYQAIAIKLLVRRLRKREYKYGYLRWYIVWDLCVYRATICFLTTCYHLLSYYGSPTAEFSHYNPSSTQPVRFTAHQSVTTGLQFIISSHGQTNHYTSQWLCCYHEAAIQPSRLR